MLCPNYLTDRTKRTNLIRVIQGSCYIHANEKKKVWSVCTIFASFPAFNENRDEVQKSAMKLVYENPSKTDSACDTARERRPAICPCTRPAFPHPKSTRRWGRHRPAQAYHFSSITNTHTTIWGKRAASSSQESNSMSARSSSSSSSLSYTCHTNTPYAP